MKEARILLERLTEEFPPGENQRHNITINSKGNIIITLMIDGKYYPFLINEDDLNKTSFQLLEEIRELHNKMIYLMEKK